MLGLFECLHDSLNWCGCEGAWRTHVVPQHWRSPGARESFRCGIFRINFAGSASDKKKIVRTVFKTQFMTAHSKRFKRVSVVQWAIRMFPDFIQAFKPKVRIESAALACISLKLLQKWRSSRHKRKQSVLLVLKTLTRMPRLISEFMSSRSSSETDLSHKSWSCCSVYWPAALYAVAALMAWLMALVLPSKPMRWNAKEGKTLPIHATRRRNRFIRDR